jgi:hypothetical protein
MPCREAAGICVRNYCWKQSSEVHRDEAWHMLLSYNKKYKHTYHLIRRRQVSKVGRESLGFSITRVAVPLQQEQAWHLEGRTI